MSIPRQVEEAATLAEELHAKIFPSDVEEEQAEETEAVQEENETEVEVPVQVEEEESVEKLKARYNSLKGKYDAEVPRLHHELKELKDNIFQKIEAITKQKEEPVVPEADPLIEKFKEEYGEEYFKFIDHFSEVKARKIAQAMLDERLQPVQQQVESVEETQIKVAQENFMSYLDDKVEKGAWRNLWFGKDEKFASFLEKTEPNSGFKYRDILQHHSDNWDGDGVATVFNTYLGTTAPPEPQKPSKPNPAKEAIIAPSRNTQHATPVVADKMVWTQASFDQFKKDDRAGKYDAETSKAMWDDLLAAVAENRIR